MLTADLVAEFLRLRKEQFQLIASRYAAAIGTSPAMVSAVLKGDRTFPMRCLDETALFFGFTDVVAFLTMIREEVKKAGRYPPDPTPEEEARLRMLRQRERPLPDEEDS